MYRATTCIISERQTAHRGEDSCVSVLTVCHRSANDLDGFLVAVPESQAKQLGQNPRHRTRAYRLQEWLHLLRRLNQLHQKPRLRDSLRLLSVLASSVPKDNTTASERFITPHQLSASSTIAPLPCVELWMFKCAVVGCAVVKANEVSDAENKNKTCAT